MKQIYILLVLAAGLSGNAQSKFLDYMVTDKNDTIYGTIRHEFNYVLYERKDMGATGIRFVQHSLKKAKALHYRGKNYFPKPKVSDPIYESKSTESDASMIKYKFNGFISKEPALKDYIVTLAGDTVYGAITFRPFDKILTSGNGQKYVVESDFVKGYRYQNRVFVLMDEATTGLFHDKKGFLEVILDGKAKFYEYTATNNDRINLNAAGAYYFVGKGKTLYLIEHYKAMQMLSEIFADNPALQKRILEGEFSYENIYLIVDYYNNN